MATHRVKVREDLLQKLITLSEETGKPINDLIEEVLDWARHESQMGQASHGNQPRPHSPVDLNISEFYDHFPRSSLFHSRISSGK